MGQWSMGLGHYNGSIIYYAQYADINHWINVPLQRTEFMLFAPVTTDNLADRYFENWMSEDVTAE